MKPTLRRSVVLAVATLALASCSKDGRKEPTAKERPDCEAAIQHVMGLMGTDPTTRGMDTTMANSIHALASSRCRTDNWSTDAVQCFATAASLEGAAACGSKLTAKQSETLTQQMGYATGTAGSGSVGSGQAPEDCADVVAAAVHDGVAPPQQPCRAKLTPAQSAAINKAMAAVPQSPRVN